MGSGGHLGFMQITRVAQSCSLGNKTKFVLGPLHITNHQKIIHKKENFEVGALNI